MTSAEVVAVVLKDRAFYQRSGGGVTFSGGEPLLQPAFLLEALGECRRLGVPTAMETSAHGSFEALREAARHLDTLYIDIKHMDAEKHRELTGASNTLILDNIRKLDGEHAGFVIRIPVIPGRNDEPGQIEATARFCLELESVTALELLPYHPLGEHKYSSLNRDYPLHGLAAPSGQRMAELRYRVDGIVAARRIPVAVVDA
jgi:pyruvate formate lyase activating enzyme